MALIVSAASGNFNETATWVGGVVPTVGDEARASNGHTITITANATCDEVSNAGTGIFTLNDGITLTANVTNKSVTGGRHCLQFNAASPAVGFVVGRVTGSAASNGSFGINNMSTGAVTITGTGSVIGGQGTGSGAVNNASSGTITITTTGGVTGGQNSGNSFGAQNATTGGTLIIIGNVTGGTSTGTFGVNNVSTGSVTITGNVTASAAAGVNNISTGTLTITGDCTASTSANAVSSTSSTPRVSGSFISAPNGRLAVNASSIILLTAPTLAKTRYALNGTGTYVDMFTADNTGLGPATNNVRSGVTYSGMTGTLAVPLPSQVAVGVATDNTVGTAFVTGSDIATAVWGAATRTITGGTVDTLTNAPSVPTPSQIASQVRTELATELGRIDAATSTRATQANVEAIKAKTDLLNTDRLAQASTVDITGAQIAAALS